MLFSDHFFLLYFFPSFLLAYLIVYFFSRSFLFTNIVLLLGSLLFYSGFGLNFLSVLFLPIFFDFFLGIGIEKINNKKLKKTLYLFGISSNILILGYFKYSAFFASQLLEIPHFHFQILKSLATQKLLLPVGISFVTFQRISYLTDIYKSRIKACKNFLHYLVYALLFPHLIAGPIVRYSEIMSELKKRILSFETFFHGIKYFSIGLFLKIMVADQLFLLDELISTHVANLDTLQACILVFGYSIRLYFDFLGYSLMAIGIAAFLGFHFPDNFDSPYLSSSLTEFWRRWNITLSNWIRDYIYIPLGGNRKGELRTQCNLLIAMIFAGIWHGAGWNFAIWGTLHGIWLIFERVLPGKLSSWIPKKLSQFLTFIGVSLLWVIFRYSDWSTVHIVFHGLAQITFFDLDFITHNTVVATIPAGIIALIWLLNIREKSIRDISPSYKSLLFFSGLLFFSICFSLTKRSISFIYFQF